MTDRDPRWVDHAQQRTDFVDKVIPKLGIGVELGVYCGDFTRVLLDVAQPHTLHLIDPWYLIGDDWSAFDVTGPTTREALTMVQNVCADEIASGTVELHIADDLVLLPIFPDRFFTWAYIDTQHTYEQCSAELSILASKVAQHGVIAGDDWNTDPTHPHHGVCCAVKDFVAHQPYDLIYADDGDGQWAIGHRF